MSLTIENLKTFLTNVQTISKDQDAKEHSYRKDLQELLEAIDPKISVLQEGKRLTSGTPDFRLKKNDVLVAFLEAKNITENLNDKKHFKQVEKYQDGLENLCFTNNLDWQFFSGKELIFETTIAKLVEPGKLQIQEENLSQLVFHLNEFPNRHSITIKNSKQLAELMAKKTRFMRETLIDILHQDEETQNHSEIYNEYETFKKILIHDLTIKQFSDIYAQTISYGLFTARYYDPTLKTFSRQEAANLLPKSNPFLRKLFQTIAGYDLDERLVWVVDNLVDLLLQTDTRTLMHEFGIKLNLDDPVLHFYETFLGEYDPATRKARGVYYTPDPVVKFMVKSVDEILQKEFDLPMGLADNSKIQKEISREESQNKLNSKAVGRGRGQKHFEEFHKVQVLDPATGTGTFLLEVFNQIHKKFEKKPALWQSYAQNDLIPRIHGFEILMASYTMVHLKLAMFLTEKGVNLQEMNKRLSVYLTNSLEEATFDDGSLFSLTKWLTDEAGEASEIKNNKPVMVVIGNPPYSVSSSNSGEWIQDLIKDYKKDLGEKKLNLDDDYIKFIRYGQHYIQKNGEGILAYISNNSFIDGVTHRRMRESLMETFDKIYILDLHGNSKKKETAPDGSKDENVFDIQQGVSINIFVKKKK